MAELGQKWAEKCEFEHGQPQFDPATLGYEKLGQNLYVNSDLTKGVGVGVQAWFDEKSDYTYDSLTCAPGKACGHYTQVGSFYVFNFLHTKTRFNVFLKFYHRFFSNPLTANPVKALHFAILV